MYKMSSCFSTERKSNLLTSSLSYGGRWKPGSWQKETTDKVSESDYAATTDTVLHWKKAVANQNLASDTKIQHKSPSERGLNYTTPEQTDNRCLHVGSLESGQSSYCTNAHQDRSKNYSTVRKFTKPNSFENFNIGKRIRVSCMNILWFTWSQRRFDP